MKWTKTLPKIKHNCILLVATWYDGDYEYEAYHIVLNDCDDGVYWAAIDNYGKEDRAIEDIEADYYCILPEIKK